MPTRGFLHQHAPALLRHSLFAAAFLTYLFDPVDIVWRFARASAHPRAYEHLGFATAAILLALAALRTASHANPAPLAQPPNRLPHLLFALAIAALLPRWGALLLVVGEAALVFLVPSANVPRRSDGRSAVYWTAFVAMAIFSLTLQDRLADVLFALTFLVALWADFTPAAALT